MFKNEFIKYEDRLYILKRKIKEELSPNVEVWKEHLGAVLVLRKDRLLFFVESVPDLDILPPETEFFTFIHHAALVFDLDNIEIGEGSFIGAFSIVTTNVKLGKHSILNRGNHIGHDTIAGDYLSMMPGAIISGNVTVGDRLYMGTGSSIREKLEICDDVTIGLNSGVVKNIKEPGIYVGLPTKKV